MVNENIPNSTNQNNITNPAPNEPSTQSSNIDIAGEIEELINQTKSIKREEDIGEILDKKVEEKQTEIDKDQSNYFGLVLMSHLPLASGLVSANIEGQRRDLIRNRFTKDEATDLIESANVKYETALTKTNAKLHLLHQAYQQKEAETEAIIKEKDREITKTKKELETKKNKIGDLLTNNETLKENNQKKLDEVKAIKDNEISKLKSEKDNEIQELRNQLNTQEEIISNFQVRIERLDEELNHAWNMKDEYQLKWDVVQEKLVQRREITRRLMKQIDEERDIHQDAMKIMDNWYHRFINEELGNELLQTLKERRFLAQKNQELENNIELIQQLSETQLIQNLTLVKNYQEKLAKMKEAKNKVKGKLKSETHRFYLHTLFNTQEQLVRLEGAMKIIRSPSEKQLLEVKKNLSEILTEEEITTLCQLKAELTKLEIQLENLLVEKLEANVICLPLSTYKK